MGYEWYDLWGVAPENEADDAWASISVFKRKFGGQAVNLVPTLDYVYDAAAYEHYGATETSAAKIERSLDDGVRALAGQA